MRKVYVEDGDIGVLRMFVDRGWTPADQPETADLICFTGGSDVNPLLYRTKKHPATLYNTQRDEDCVKLANLAEDYQIPMVGICRGAQFLNCYNGGTMWQHVQGHAMRGTHEAIDIQTGETFDVTSTHHQMMCPSDEAQVILIGNLPVEIRREYDSPQNINYLPESPDIEAVYYEYTNSFCYQPHPEYVNGSHKCQEYFFQKVEELLLTA